MTNINILFLLRAFCCVFIFSYSTPSIGHEHLHSDEARPTYAFGIVPQFTLRHIVINWVPILHMLEKETGFKFELRSSPTIPDFEDKFLRGDFDLAYMNPYHSLIAAEKGSYRPMVRNGKKKLYGILVVKKNSLLSNLKDMRGKKIAFPAPNALGASMLIRAQLHKDGIPFQPNYVQTHSSVYLNVILGEAAAGGGVMSTLNKQPKEIQNALKVIFKTPHINSHPIVSHDRIPKEHVQIITKAFFSIAATERGRKLLKAVNLEQIHKATIEDYLELKNMGLKTLYQ